MIEFYHKICFVFLLKSEFWPDFTAKITQICPLLFFFKICIFTHKNHSNLLHFSSSPKFTFLPAKSHSNFFVFAHKNHQFLIQKFPVLTLSFAQNRSAFGPKKFPEIHSKSPFFLKPWYHKNSQKSPYSQKILFSIK